MVKFFWVCFRYFFEIGALIVFSGMFLAVLIQVFASNVLAMPTPWAEELSRFFCVWTVFLASASAVRRGAHITINILLRRLSGKLLLAITLLIQVITTLFLICVFYGTLLVMKSSYDVSATSLQISISYFYLGLLIGSFGMLVYLFVGMARNMRSLLAG
ncbi:MAG: TRAP transporter small permease subunit [Deltaproteobacteria bacterium]|nr:TRAP transporter small permease subunit [Deltaproteobacteria bacterium]MBW2078764.1 TRAP transporter small permease subunit [Deltaproteobacteria bacterium]